MSTSTAPDSRPVPPRLLFVGLWAVAAASYTALLLLKQPLAAAGTFVGGAVAAVTYQRVGGVRFDERDTALYETAAARTVQVLGVVSGVAFPSLVAASALGYYEWTAFTAGVGATVAGVFVLWLAMLVAIWTTR